MFFDVKLFVVGFVLCKDNTTASKSQIGNFDGVIRRTDSGARVCCGVDWYEKWGIKKAVTRVDYRFW